MNFTRNLCLAAVIVVPALACSSGSLCAQTFNLGDYLTVENDRLMVFKEGVAKPAEGEIALSDGSKVTTNGLFILRPGVERPLQPRQKLTMDGFFVGTDGTLILPEDHITVRKGQAMLVKDGVGKALSQELRLSNGSKVMPNGLVHQADGKTIRLLDGQLLGLSGNALPAVDHVMKRDGKVVLQKDGGLITLGAGRTIMMSDGSKVAGDGTIAQADGTKLVVGEGQRIKLTGPALSRPR